MTTNEYQNFDTKRFFSDLCGAELRKSGTNTVYRCPRSNGKAHEIYVVTDGPKNGVWSCHHANCATETGCSVSKGGPCHFLQLVEPDLSTASALERLKEYGRADPRGGVSTPPPRKPAASAVEKPKKVWSSLSELAAKIAGWPPVAATVGKGGRVYGSPWVYHTKDGREAGAIIRIDGNGKKTFQQVKRVEGGWIAGGLPEPRPLYRLPHIKDGAVVLIVEGEKCADALAGILPSGNWWVTTPSQGAKSPQKSDWSTVSGKKVVIFQDNDQAGRDFASTVTGLCRKAGAVGVSVVEPFYGKDENDGRDIADFIQDGGQSETIIDSIARAVSESEPLQKIPTIRIEYGLGTISKMANAGITALMAGKAGIYKRSNDLVMIREDEKSKLCGIRWPIGEPKIIPVSPAVIRDKLDQSAIWERFDSRTQQWITARPPRDAVETIMSQEWEQLPELSMIFETPTMRLDGSIVDRPGWDKTTGIFFMPRAGEHWNIPNNPTSNQIKAAKEALLEVHCDFPFEKECHRAAAIAGILTLLSGLIYSNRPLFMWDANVRGAGKTLGADVCSLIATGRDFPKMTQGIDASEDDKRITALAMAGARSALIDNIVGKFGNSSIDTAITSEGSWKCRLLGQNRTWEGPIFITWFATGNNIEVQGDLSRRVIPIKIMSEEERPEQRTGYRHSDLRAWVRSERVRLATAGLTILRGYQVAGKPDQKLINFGSFEDWSKTVRNAVVWAGLADPYEGNEDIQQKADTDAVALGNLLQAWYATFREIPITLAKIAKMEPLKDPEEEKEIKHNESLEALKEALSAIAGNDRGDGWNLRKAGQILTRFEKRVIRGLRLEQCEKTYLGCPWKVKRMDVFNPK